MDAFNELQQLSSTPRVRFSDMFKMSRMRRREAKWGLLFISPWLIGFLLFYAVPMVVSPDVSVTVPVFSVETVSKTSDVSVIALVPPVMPREGW